VVCTRGIDLILVQTGNFSVKKTAIYLKKVSIKNIAYTENTEPHCLNAEQIISLVAESAEFCFCLLVGDMIA